MNSVERSHRVPLRKYKIGFYELNRFFFNLKHISPLSAPHNIIYTSVENSSLGNGTVISIFWHCPNKHITYVIAWPKNAFFFNSQGSNIYKSLPTSHGNQYFFILSPWSMSQGWTKMATSCSSAAYSYK